MHVCELENVLYIHAFYFTGTHYTQFTLTIVYVMQTYTHINIYFIVFKMSKSPPIHIPNTPTLGYELAKANSYGFRFRYIIAHFQISATLAITVSLGSRLSTLAVVRMCT